MTQTSLPLFLFSGTSLVKDKRKDSKGRQKSSVDLCIGEFS